MPVSNLIHHIRNVAESLRPAERKVADMVLADIDFAMRASITELALRAEVSEPSVTRFCRAVGAHGLRDFKMRLAQSAAGNVPFALATEMAAESGGANWGGEIGTLLDKVTESVVQGVTHARASLDPAVFEAAVAALGSARRVYFFGVGAGSGLVVQDAALRMLRLDIAASAFTDAHLQRLYAGLLEPGDVAFAISQSGRSVEVNESIQIAKERGATTIALTSAGSRLAWVVDIPLLLRVPAAADPHAPAVVRIAHLAVLDALALGVSLGLGPKALAKMRDAQARSDGVADDGAAVGVPEGGR
ncbi:MurR/RpiR family transcriptional regulator [Paraburkholderia acidisoli]|uniref:SIS domain-containing protein n=1 Tax=Paraburkholderia acidisoli TaxID=2571748 RepID=A0A7Z2GLC5_9BURK|nr:MurR/RpiR family transcriptional regulator [Paraburkholderia acidisoli]QGZ63885.1 SIS domain-containing protein [Paraburkholderia acidisoli]